jgi:polysaccharide biosynthesis protein PslH
MSSSKSDIRKKLLFISPVMPDQNGTGVYIRSYNFIKALSRDYDIHLIIVSENFKRIISRPVKPFFCVRINQIGIGQISLIPAIIRYLLFRLGISGCWIYPKTSVGLRYTTISRIKKLQHIIAGEKFHAVHIFRLRMAPFGLWMKKAYPEIKLYLDLDDIESAVHERIAKQHSTQGKFGLAKFHQKEAKNYSAIERQWLPCFDKIYVCSEKDRKTVSETYLLNQVYTVPNAVAIRTPYSRFNIKENPFIFLFIGSFGYFPNSDGVLFFLEEILPIMRKKMSKPFLLLIVGPGLPKKIVRIIAKVPEVRYLGRVPSVKEIYEKSHAAIIPLRAGGGTRIKAIESFSFSVPVIGSRIGLEGLDVTHARHAMIADSAAEFAGYCFLVAQDVDLRERLKKQGFQLFQEKYEVAVFEQYLFNALEKGN